MAREQATTEGISQSGFVTETKGTFEPSLMFMGHLFPQLFGMFSAAI